MLSNEEIVEIRQLATRIRNLKESNYDSLTWDDAIKKLVSENAVNENDAFRKTALLKFFIAEDKQLCSLNIFLEGLDFEIASLKKHAQKYAISEFERLALKQEIENYLSCTKYPKNQEKAFDYYRMLIKKVFISNTLLDLMASLSELSEVLKKYYPKAFQEVHMLVEFNDKLEELIKISQEGITKKEISSALGVSVELAGAIMYRFAQLGIFEVSKKGRSNIYKYKKSEFDVNTIRKEWDWLWSSPYKRLD